MTSQQLDELQGQLLATQIALRALILARPDPEAAALWVQQEMERWIAVGLHKPLADGWLAGMEKAKTRLLPSATDLARVRRK